MNLQELADSLPSMGGTQLGPRLRTWAAECRSGAIVEVGSWLGAGTAQLSLGARASGAPIHVYDQWLANESEVEKAALFGVDLHVGQDTLPWVISRLEPFDVDTTFHQGPVNAAQWIGLPIGLYVDDAGKRWQDFLHKMATFRPYFVDGCIVVLMDYYHYETGGIAFRAQQIYRHTKRTHFAQVDDHVAGTSTAVFRYRRRWRRRTPA